MKHNKNKVGCRLSPPRSIPVEVTCKACLQDSPTINIGQLIDRLNQLCNHNVCYRYYSIRLDRLAPGDEAKRMHPEFRLDDINKTITFSYYE
jgi:hypothetical protein